MHLAKVTLVLKQLQPVLWLCITIILKSNWFCHLPVLWPLLTVYQNVCNNKKIKHEWPCCFGSHKWLEHDDFYLRVLETLLVFSVILQS